MISKLLNGFPANSNNLTSASDTISSSSNANVTDIDAVYKMLSSVCDYYFIEGNDEKGLALAGMLQIDPKTRSEDREEQVWLISRLLTREIYELFITRDFKTEKMKTLGENGEDMMRRLFVERHNELSLLESKLMNNAIPNVLLDYSISQRIVLSTDKSTKIFNPIIVMQLNVMRFASGVVQNIFIELSLDDLEALIHILKSAIENVE